MNKFDTLVALNEQASTISKLLDDASTAEHADAAMERYYVWQQAAEDLDLSGLEEITCMLSCINKYMACAKEATGGVAFMAAPDNPAGTGPKKTLHMCHANFRMCLFMCSANKIITVLR